MEKRAASESQEPEIELSDMIKTGWEVKLKRSGTDEKEEERNATVNWLTFFFCSQCNQRGLVQTLQSVFGFCFFFYIVSPLKGMNNTPKCMKKEWENSCETQVQSSIRCLIEQPARQHMFARDRRSDVIGPCVFCRTAKMDVKIDGCCIGEMRSFLDIHVDCAVCSCQNS